MTRVSEILARALELLDRPRGWTRGTLRRGNGIKGEVAYCAVGALHQAREEFSDGYRVGRNAEMLLGDVISENYGSCRSVIGWNDNDRRTKAEVLAMFEKALVRSIESEGLTDADG